MGNHVRADLDRMRWLSDQIDEAATTMSEGQHDALTLPAVFGMDAVPVEAFGNTSGAGACHTAWLAAEADALSAYGNLTGMLRADVVRLGEVVTCFARMDDEAADEICAAVRGLDVFTTHVHSEASDERGDDADRIRAGQINEAVDHVVDRPGPTVFTGDLNETRTSGSRSGDTISEIVEDFGFTDAGVAAGGTSSGGSRIDYVFTSPEVGTPGIAERVEGHPSDHDGIAVDITVAPDW